LVTKTFAELGLSPKVQAAIDAAGYIHPTPIQDAAIPVAVTGRDVLGIAQTGTGKTASFTLPMISRLETGRARARMPRSLILAPTRELAAQVAQSFEKYGINHKLNLALLIGGVSMDEQTRKLDRGVDVLIATPGRLLDHFQRGRVMLMGVEILVIDEADRMLDMGFIPDIEKICKLLPPRRQTLFFSATMPPEITRLVDQFMNEPERIEVARPATTAKTITQRFCFCPHGEDWAKRDMLRELIRTSDVKNAIIFCNRKRDVAILHKSLTKHGFNAGALHGDMDQRSRMETLDGFRSGEITLLAASDVAARGLDIPDVSHVFNFDLPWQSDDYVHRIGRTGRAGKEGSATSLVTLDDIKLMQDIEKMTGDTVEWIGDPPSEDDMASAATRKRGRGGRSASGGRGSSSSGRRPSALTARDGGGSANSRSRPQRRRPAAGEGEQPEVVDQRFAASGGPVSATTEAHAQAEEAKPQRPERRRGRRGSSRQRTAGAREASEGQSAASQETESASTASRNNKRNAASGDEASGKPQTSKRSSGRRPARRGTSATETATSAPAAGFADNIPAFLKRPIRKPATKPAASSSREKALASD